MGEQPPREGAHRFGFYQSETSRADSSQNRASSGSRKAGAKSSNFSAVENPSAGSTSKGTSDTGSPVIETQVLKPHRFVFNTGKSGEAAPRAKKVILGAPNPSAGRIKLFPYIPPLLS